MERLTSSGQRLVWRDVSEMVVGSCVLAFPVSVTEEVWRISETLPGLKALYMSIWSVIFIALFTYHRYFSGQLRERSGRFVFRVCAAYFVTMVTSASILWAVGQLTTAETVGIAINRVVIVSFPASFAATVVDGMSRNHAP